MYIGGRWSMHRLNAMAKIEGGMSDRWARNVHDVTTDSRRKAGGVTRVVGLVRRAGEGNYRQGQRCRHVLDRMAVDCVGSCE